MDWRAILKVPAGYVGLGDAVDALGVVLDPIKADRLVKNTLLPDPRAKPRANISPAFLMQAKYQVASFGFRDAEIADLTDWCRSTEPVAWRLLHGDTGRGKTRLCVELCARLRDWDGEDWYAGILDVRQTQAEIDKHLTLLLTRPRQTLIVLDYAERHPALAEALLELSADRPEKYGPLRIVFVTRRNAEMWDRMFVENSVLAEMGRAALAPMPLAPAPDNASAQAIFDQAFADYARYFDKTHPAPAVDPSALVQTRAGQADQAPDFVLIHMLALLAVLAPEELTEGAAAVTRDTVLARFFDRERAHWAKGAEAANLDPVLNTSGALHGVAALLTLAGQQGAIPDNAAACRVVGLERLLGGRDAAQVQQVVTLFRDLYPGEDIGGVAPDLFGDYVIRAREGLPWDAIFAAEGFTDAQALSALTRLNWIAQKWPEEGAALIHRALEANPERVLPMVIQTAVQSGDPIGRVAAAWLEQRGDVALVRMIDGKIPTNTLALRELAVVVGSILLDEVADDAERAELLVSYNNRLSDMGNREAALAAAEQAVTLYRDLFEINPESYARGFLGSLSNFSNRLSEIGKKVEALYPIKEAISIYSKFNFSDYLDFDREYALLLNTYAGRLFEVGRLEDAILFSEKSVSMYRQLESQFGDSLDIHMAASLSNYGNILLSSGRYNEALKSTRESILIYRKVYASKNEAVLPYIALSMSNISSIFSALGRNEDALSAIDEAISIRRKLFSERPYVFGGQLSISLGALTDVRMRNEDIEGAFATSAEAIDVLTPSFLQLPQAFGHWMMMHLQRYIELAEELGHEPDEQKLAPIVEILQQMRQQAPDD